MPTTTPTTLQMLYPLPWRVEVREGTTRTLDASGEIVCDDEHYYPSAVMADVQGLIVKAVNHHDRLVAALRSFLQYEDGRELQRAEEHAAQLLKELDG